MIMKRFLLAGIVAAVTVAACSDDDDPIVPVNKTVMFKATMNGAGEVPAITSGGTGSFTGVLDTSTNVFTYDVTYTGLGSNVNNGHLHGPSAATATGGVILNFATLPGATFTTGATAGAAHGVVTLNSGTQVSATVNGDSLRKLLYAGLIYVNIHTTTNGGGEIRGQIAKQ